MLEQSYDALKSIEESRAIAEMVNSKGWKLIEPILQDAIDILKLKRRQTDDPAIIMACVRQEDGISLIKETIHEFISRGEEAARNSSD